MVTHPYKEILISRKCGKDKTSKKGILLIYLSVFYNEVINYILKC